MGGIITKRAYDLISLCKHYLWPIFILAQCVWQLFDVIPDCPTSFIPRNIFTFYVINLFRDVKGKILADKLISLFFKWYFCILNQHLSFYGRVFDILCMSLFFFSCKRLYSGVFNDNCDNSDFFSWLQFKNIFLILEISWMIPDWGDHDWLKCVDNKDKVFIMSLHHDPDKEDQFGKKATFQAKSQEFILYI